MTASAAPLLLDADRLDWLRLIRSDNVGPATFRRLMQRFGSARRALDALPDLAQHGGSRTLRLCSASDAEAELAAITTAGAQLVAIGEPSYPPLLAHVEGAPPLITVLGDPGHFTKPTVAIVGARNASLNGRKLARTLAADLGAAGWVVVSGLARGIDTAAHEGGLAGGTVAVLAGGADVIYPMDNADLYARIRDHGVIVSEMPIGTQPQARHFPTRNRLISGIAWGVVVVEARPASGSLITARRAADQGRVVLAIPGSPLDPRAHGANDLIRDGATLVQSAADIIEALAPMARGALREPSGPGFLPLEPMDSADSEINAARDIILDALSPTPVTVDELLRSCQLSPAAVATVLLELELAGRLERHPGNQVSLLDTP